MGAEAKSNGTEAAEAEPELQSGNDPIRDAGNGKLVQRKSQKETERRKWVFREKQFQIRPALLDKYFDIDGAGERPILSNFFVAVFVLATMATFAQDFNQHGNPFHHFWLIAWNFRRLPQALFVWCAMFASAIVFPFFGLRFWSQFVAPKWGQQTLLLCSAYLAYQIAFFFYSIRAIFWFNLEGACSFIVTCENTRIAMKTHSFFRENIAKTKKTLKETETDKGQQKQPAATASLGHFVYFMFCPALLYRDSYPVSPTRSWRKVCRHLCSCLASIYLVSLCFSQWIIPRFAKLSFPEDIRWHLLVSAIFPSIIPGGVSLFLGIFYGLLHSWLSMFAEALRFGDRHFYANWWSSRNMAEYYRNWNLVVHDWLYAYVYRDLARLLGTQWGPPVSQCLVFFLSSFFHEYWFAISLRMFYPAIFTLYFIFGGIFFLFSRLIKKPYIWNTLMWWNLLIGTGMFIVCYASEWYARQRCARAYDNFFFDLLIPRSWACLRTI